MRITVSLLMVLSCLFASGLRAGEDAAPAGEGLVVSEFGLDFGSFEQDGYAIVPVPEAIPAAHPDDYAPPMLFEIVRPNQTAFSIGRIMSSCACLKLVAEKRDFAAGERAFIVLRNVKPTPKDGATYAFFVKRAAPADMTLRYDVFVKSTRAKTE